MDGVKKSLNNSIQLKLSFTLSVSILLVALVAGICSFVFAFDEAHELQDDILRQVAQLIDQKQLSSSLAPITHLKGSDAEAQVIIQHLKANQTTLNNDTGTTLPISPTLPDGLHTQDVGDKTFRVLVKTLLNGDRILVAQPSSLRNEIAYDSAFRTVMPFLIFIPVLLFLVSHLVRSMFRPIATLSNEIDQRAEQDLRPIESNHLPTELRPFVVAINSLFLRVERSMETQRRFVADSAHELRSPLTALSLQAERLADADMSHVARERLNVLQLGIKRGRSLLEQLLTLAKVQTNAESAKAWVSVQGIYRRVLEDLMPLAEEKQIDIGIEGVLDAQVWLNELELMTVVKNLVDNAIRYTPSEGRIDLSVHQENQQVILQIQDNGPGIPTSERERVLDPFYRILGGEQVGSGLGLSIVNTLAARWGAKIDFSFTNKEAQSGLQVKVYIPVQISTCS
ncbi:ATP-binding protein [Acinetobacter nosocomialis]|uniref:ATP-binding protein n=1 Tax=Acinetobacter nosocomialis TaxID=106654 RepID=UPI0011246B6F|nr:ATP-binding protein [Acinetobacter nosocomialis]MDE1704938.1 ATP-binding protein [Acinetobacter nosocomialis]HDG7213453.1 two-component sensor histidine kinase [Acinetobacter nosocomialis]